MELDDPAEVSVAFIGQVSDDCQAEKKPDSEAAGPLNSRFVAACGSVEIGRVIGTDLNRVLRRFAY